MFITADTGSVEIHEVTPRTDQASLKRFQSFPTPLIGDAMGRMGLMDAGLAALHSNARCVGPAFTVLTREGDNLAIHVALDYALPGDVLVINALGGRTRAVFGDLLAEICLARGIAGVIIDGLSRDAAAILELGLPVWARGVSPAGPFKHGPGAVGIPVACGSLVVRSGDIVVADGDGIAVVAAERSDVVAARVEELDAAEGALRRKIQASVPSKRPRFA